MTTIKYNTGTEWIDVHTTYKATETTHGVAKIATSKEVSEGTNDESFVTPKKLQEVVATLPIESEVVHKDGEEIIVGLKTFSGNDDGVGNIVVNNPTLGISDEVDSTPQFGEIEFTDKDGTLVGSLDTIRGIDDGNGYNAIRLSSANGEGISAHTPLELRNYDDGIVVAVAPTPNESANGSEVITAEWIQPKLEAESKARTDEDTRLAGLITAEETARTNADNNLQQQITKEVEDRTNADNNLQQQITQEVTDRTNADNNLQQQITTNLNSINAINQNIETINEILETKQDQLTESQLAAVNSGVTSATVTQVATNVSNIVELQNKKADKETTYTKTEVDTLLEPKATTEYVNEELAKKSDITYVDGEVDKLEQSITTNVNTINTRIDNEVSTINNTLDTKADKSDTYTKAEVDAKVSSVYRFKGSVDKVEDLPKEGNVEGDVYNVTSTGENYAWVNATDTTAGYWDDLGGDIDLTPYLTKEEAQTTYETIANVNTLSTKLDTKVGELNESITTNVNTINTRIDNEVKDLEDAIALKSDTTYVNEQLALKADKSDTYTKTEVDNLVSPKADKTYVDEQLNLKANQSTTYTKTEVDNLLEPKATTEYVDGQIDLVEESITTNVETINDRIDTEVETLNTTITTNVNTINGRIDDEVESINSALDLKADITYVDGQIDLVEESITTNVETLNKAIDLKADKETTYTKTEVDNLLSPKATTEYVDGEVDKLEQSITTNVNTINTRIDNEVKDLEDAIALKSDKTYVDEELGKKADKSSIGDATITFKKNGASIGTFTTNQATNGEIDIEVPTKVSELTNDKNYQTDTDVTNVANEIKGLITAEETARTNADNTLQTQIDAINARKDVVDIVSTYDELVAYPTTDLTDKDIVKVISDSSHNDTSSYFRWNVETSAWDYVGSESATYTKAESDEKYALKTTTVNGQALSSNVTLTYSDVNALADTTKYGKELAVDGQQVSLKDQDGNVLSTITTQDTKYTAGDGIEINENNQIINTKVSAVWGNIEGTLSNQTDLQDALNLKANQSTTYTKTEVDNLLSPKATTEYVDGEVDKLEQSITTNVETINKAIDLKADKTEIPTKVSELENDSGYLTSHQDISGKADITYVDEQLALKANASDVYTKEQSDAKYLTEHQDLSDYALKTEIKNGKLTIQKNGVDVATFTANQDGDVVANIEADTQVNADWNATSGVAQILNKPTNVSAFTNDAGYLTQHQDISGKADTSYVEEELGKKADKSDTYTKAEVDAKVSSVYRFKGSVANYDALPTEGNVVGDVYNVEDTGDNYAWTEEGWDKLAGTIDLTPYLTKSEAQTTYETIANVNTLKETVNTKADKSTTLEGYGITDITNINTSNVIDNDGEMISNLTINENEVILTSVNLAANIQGGKYIDITKPNSRETLYQHSCHPMFEAQLGFKICNDAFTTINVFDYEGIDINNFSSLELVDEPIGEFYAYKLPSNLIPNLVPMYHEDKSIFNLRDMLTDTAYQQLGTPDTSDESKDAFLNNMTGGFVDTTSPLYFVKFSNVTNSDGEVSDALGCSYQDVNGDYILNVAVIWDISSSSEIIIGEDSDTLVIDWNQSALDLINNKDSLPSQEGNSGKFLTTDGVNASWQEIDALPSQTDNAGKVLTTDGTEAKWEKFYPGVIRVWE